LNPDISRQASKTKSAQKEKNDPRQCNQASDYQQYLAQHLRIDHLSYHSLNSIFKKQNRMFNQRADPVRTGVQDN
jgi:hypothetical protein